MTARVTIFDTTLRDGEQSPGIALNTEEKLEIAAQLTRLGVDVIEAGFPAASDGDFASVQVIAREIEGPVIAALARATATDVDSAWKALEDAARPRIHVFIATSPIHMYHKLQMEPAEVKEAAIEAVTRARSMCDDVEFSPEDGTRSDADFLIDVCRAAVAAGATTINIPDTVGYATPGDFGQLIARVVAEVKGSRDDVVISAHCHNDLGLAVANALAAVDNGARQVEGAINGIGERCGSANLCSILPNLQLKMGRPVLGERPLARLREVSNFVAEIANLIPSKHQPYVGDSAFAHKGGVHIHAVQKNPATYEHIIPERVGNRQRVLVSDHAGRSGLVGKVETYGLRIAKEHPKLQELLATLKDLENQGYQFEGAEGSLELLTRKVVGRHQPSFRLLGFRVIVEKRQADEPPISEATVMIKVGEAIEHTAAVGSGPVNALDHALRKALEKFYPQLSEVKLLDYKVRVLAASHGTASKVRVLIESGDHKEKWGTVGVSENIMEASWQALADSIEYKLLRGDR